MKPRTFTLKELVEGAAYVGGWRRAWLKWSDPNRGHSTGQSRRRNWLKDRARTINGRVRGVPTIEEFPDAPHEKIVGSREAYEAECVQLAVFQMELNRRAGR